MIDVAELSMFLLLWTPSKAAKPSAAKAVECAADARPSAQPKDPELLKSSEQNITSGYKRKYHAVINEGADQTRALAEAHIAAKKL